MDSELKELAMLALRNAFWRDFSGLCNLYLKAAAGLNTAAQERMMGELTSIYGRDPKAGTGNSLQILVSDVRTVNGERYIRMYGYETIKEALAHENAYRIAIGDYGVFEKRDGEWYFIG